MMILRYKIYWLWSYIALSVRFKVVVRNYNKHTYQFDHTEQLMTISQEKKKLSIDLLVGKLLRFEVVV